MNGHSKMRLGDINSSRSMGLSDLISFPQTQKSNEETNSNGTCEAAEVLMNVNNRLQNSPSELEEDEDANAKSSAVLKLSRYRSVSSNLCHSFRISTTATRTTTTTTTTTSLQSAVKRVFSMGRPSSDSERYCRFYDQFAALEPPTDVDDAEGAGNNAIQTTTISIKENKKRISGRIFKACRRLLGF